MCLLSSTAGLCIFLPCLWLQARQIPVQPWPLTAYQDDLSARVVVSRLRPALRKGICLSRGSSRRHWCSPHGVVLRVLQSCENHLSPSQIPQYSSLKYLCFSDLPFVSVVPALGILPCQGPCPGDS